MSRALSLVKGRGMSRSCRKGLASPFLVRTKEPLRGFSALMDTLMPAADAALSILAARVLNAFHDLQCSIIKV